MKILQLIFIILILGLGHAYAAEFKLATSDPLVAGDNLGYSVAIDGDSAIVGAPERNSPQTKPGSSYIFVRDDNGTPTDFNDDIWMQQAKLTPSDPTVGQEFGWSVSISGDYAIVGARHDDDFGTHSGSAYIFVRNGASWTEQVKLTASDAAEEDHFGFGVAISEDCAIIGAFQDDDGGSNSGSAYIFYRNEGGTDNWGQQSKFGANDAAVDDWFGRVVAINGDTCIVGARQADAPGSDSGAAYIFERNEGGPDNWGQQQKLTPGNAAAGDHFGTSVSISGETAIVGARFGDHLAGSDSGAAHIFVRNGGSWSEQQELTAADASAGDSFGFAAAISGNRAIVGAFQDDDGGSDSGSAYSFLRNGVFWNQRAKRIPGDPAADDQFGFSVAIDGDYAVVGAPLNDDAGGDSGSAYIYHSIGDLSLPVALSSFTAETSGETVTIKWSTASETNNLGFNLYRSETPNGQFEKVNTALISGAGTDASPHDYQFVDTDIEPGKVYYYYLEDVDFNGITEKSDLLQVDLRFDQLQVDTLTPAETQLLQNFPNPFNPETWLPYELAVKAPVVIQIYDVNGEFVRQLNLGVQVPGSYLSRENAAYWDGKDRLGRAVSSGLYFYTFTADDFQATRRMVILK